MLGIDHQNAGTRRQSLEQIQASLEASTEVDFKARNKEEIYDWVNQTLQQLNYRKLKRNARGLVRRYLSKMTGLSGAQVTRLLGCYLRGEKVKPKPYRRYRFPRRYTPQTPCCWRSYDFPFAPCKWFSDLLAIAIVSRRH